MAFGAYAALWILTALAGPRSAEPMIHRRIEGWWHARLDLAESVFDGRSHYPYFAIRTLSPAPFVLYSEYGAGLRPGGDASGHTWTLWLFGKPVPVRETLSFVTR